MAAENINIIIRSRAERTGGCVKEKTATEIIGAVRRDNGWPLRAGLCVRRSQSFVQTDTSQKSFGGDHNLRSLVRIHIQKDHRNIKITHQELKTHEAQWVYPRAENSANLKAINNNFTIGVRPSQCEPVWSSGKAHGWYCGQTIRTPVRFCFAYGFRAPRFLFKTLLFMDIVLWVFFPQSQWDSKTPILCSAAKWWWRWHCNSVMYFYTCVPLSTPAGLA